MIFFSFLIPDQPEPSSREARFVAGDMAAMEEIMALHERGIYQVGLRLFSRADMAADFCQDVFIHIYEKRHKFNPTKPLKPWLFQVALNLGRDRLRRRREIPMEIEQMPETVVETQGENEMLSVEDQAQVWKAMAEVAPIHREVLALRFSSDLKVREIAEVLGISLTAAKVRLCRGLKAFEEVYARMGGGRHVLRFDGE
jgi:RNA polymerase sigma-70 factor (ECF subfamily)